MLFNKQSRYLGYDCEQTRYFSDYIMPLAAAIADNYSESRNYCPAEEASGKRMRSLSLSLTRETIICDANNIVHKKRNKEADDIERYYQRKIPRDFYILICTFRIHRAPMKTASCYLRGTAPRSSLRYLSVCFFSSPHPCESLAEIRRGGRGDPVWSAG